MVGTPLWIRPCSSNEFQSKWYFWLKGDYLYAQKYVQYNVMIQHHLIWQICRLLHCITEDNVRHRSQWSMIHPIMRCLLGMFHNYWVQYSRDEYRMFLDVEYKSQGQNHMQNYNHKRMILALQWTGFIVPRKWAFPILNKKIISFN